MNHFIAQLKGLSLLLCLSSTCFLSATVQAALATETMLDFANSPIVSADSATPMVMIAASNDHQLYFKAYSDYSDLDHDGVIETTYKHSFDYYGYFDSYKCYNHVSGEFVPQAITTDKYCDAVAGDWSGNYLNWATMARIDTVRRILFGGKRSVDTATDTQLVRTYIPNDAHSFAKYYNGADIPKLTPFTPLTADADPRNNGLTICNTTVNNTNAVSEDVTDPPLMRVAYGNYSLWASNERWQCRWSGEKSQGNGNVAASGIDAFASSPSSASPGNADYIVKIKVCVAGLLEANCKRYPDGNFKPTGLLQVYGDKDDILFGMMAGSYSKNKSGGTLVKDIGSMSDEIDVLGNGRFIDAHTSGRAANQSDGIINAWSLYRIIKYRHQNGTYGTSGTNVSNCRWGINSFTDGQCQNWGNPFSEIYWNAIRYMAGEAKSGTFNANDSSLLSGLNTPNNWSCPLDGTNACSSLNVIAFNASTISYDGDHLDAASDGVANIWASATSIGLTDVVGAGEDIHGNSFFVGENGVDNNGLCTPKMITSLGAVEGLCPEAPRLEGTYRIAGIAHKAHTADIRSSGAQELDGDQLVDTYAVTLAPGVPEITVPIPAGDLNVKVLPACRNNSISGGGNCAIVDFKIVEPHTEVGGVATGKFYVNWEDSEQGGDYDMDMWGVISYEATSTTIEITTQVVHGAGSQVLGFGYIISGSTADGFHVHSGVNNFVRSDPGITDCAAGCSAAAGPTSHTYTVVGSSGSLLKDPLYYAAKWGAFIDENGNNIPDLITEWDRKDSEGLLNPDGIPDTYYYATNPQELETSLTNVFNAILAKTASGTAASVVASSREGQGTLVQALYATERTYNNKTVSWVGSLHSLWVDRLGHIREDDGDAILEDYTVDKVVEVYYDSASRQTRLCRHDSSSPDTFEPVVVTAGADCEGTSLPLEDLKTLWNARETLSAISDANIVNQRSYASSAANGRHILTFLDADRDNVVDSGEFVAFTPAGIDTANNHGYLNALTQVDADAILAYIRGVESPTTRNRTIDFNGDGTEETLRLGDIIHSTPTLVSTPGESFDQLYNDASYATFREQYRDRRQMLYVGANDGLLHAFNAGFFDSVNIRYRTTLTTEVAHPLGSEIWAYAPSNLLPHLKWLTDPDYTHVYYMDAKPRAFDAKIFADDATHPGGWGTVLVAGMRFGGGSMTVDSAQDGLGGGNAADDFTTRSAYVVLDITNPEVAPVLIAEITHPELGFTTSYPTALAVRANDNSVNKWFLAFGTGPTDASSATSTQDGRLLVYDLSTKAWHDDYDFTGTNNVVAANSFVSDPIAADWNLDYKADALYVGTVGGTPAAPTGDLYRLKIDGNGDPSTWTFEERLSIAQPIVMRPTLSVDKQGNQWVYVGTGRFYVNADKSSTAQQTLYGFRDNPVVGNTSSLPATTRMVDVSDAVVSTDGSTSPPYVVQNVAGVTNYDDLEALFDANGTGWKDGWKLDLPLVAGNSAARMLTEGALLGEILLITDFTPSSSLCGGDGRSSLYGLNFKTGTALAMSPVLGEATGNISIRSVDLGDGLASAPSLHIGNNPNNPGGGEETVIIQNSRGDIISEAAKLNSPVKSGETSWREEYQ